MLCSSIIPAFRSWTPEDEEVMASLDYIVKLKNRRGGRGRWGGNMADRESKTDADAHWHHPVPRRVHSSLLCVAIHQKEHRSGRWWQERHNSWELPLAIEAPSVACLHFDRTLKNLTRTKYTFKALSPLTHLRVAGCHLLKVYNIPNTAPPAEDPAFEHRSLRRQEQYFTCKPKPRLSLFLWFGICFLLTFII